MNVIKRDGTLEPYTGLKILDAISKANNEVTEGHISDFDIVDCLNGIDKIVEEKYRDSDIDIEDIHNLVESELMRFGHYKVAKRYILYREEKARLWRDGWTMTDLQRDILTTKYFYEGENFSDFLSRVGKGDRAIQKMMRDKKFLPAGRILAGRGMNEKGMKVTYSNCFVLSPPEDNIESIFDTAKNMARTYSYSGGCGADLGLLRPNGAVVHNSAKSTSGATSFMELYSTTTGLIGQKGRRGALMLSMPITHPDIVEFINIKTDLTKVTKANISLRITDSFMEAVKADGLWEMTFEVETGEVIHNVISARKLMHIIATNNWRTGEPGMLFWDRVERYHLNSEDTTFKYAGTNPCGEKPLPKGGSCLLGSMNLAVYVKDGMFNYTSFDRDVRQAIRYLDEVLTEGIQYLPLAEQKESVTKYRQVGLGIMGLATMFIKMETKYGSDESLRLSANIAHTMINAALQESARLAGEYGTYPAYDAEAVLASPFLKFVATEETMELIRKYGLRNAEVLSIAPTGSISTMIGESGGGEPLYQVSYTRRSESLGEDGDVSYEVFEPVAKTYMEKHNIKRESDLPDFFVTSSSIDYKDRINVQAVWQMYIDAAISSTVNLPEDTTVETVEALYMYAWEKGLKGITVFRDNCERVGILTTDKKDDKDPHDKNKCPECGGQIKVTNGCQECLDCGYSPCSI